RRGTRGTCAGDHPAPRPSRAHHTECDHAGGLRWLGAGARALLPRPMGRAPHADPRVQRPGRSAAQGRAARRAARQRLVRLHQPRVVPAASRRSPRRVPAVRESRLARQVTAAPGPETPRPDPHADTEPPGVAGFGTWRAVYWFGVGWLVLVVVLLTLFTEMLS